MGIYGPPAIIKIKIHPKAKKNSITGILNDGTIKICVTAPPVDGKANMELIKLLAKILETNKSEIEILTGLNARTKTVRIHSLDNKSLMDRIECYLQD